MPDKQTLVRARKDRREGKSPSTQAGEFVKEEMDHIREGKHGARSTKQAIAIGLSKARRAGVKVPPPPAGSASRGKAKSATGTTRAGGKVVSAVRSRATRKALKREGHAAASPAALARHAKSAARKRSPAQRSASAKQAARTRKRTAK